MSRPSKSSGGLKVAIVGYTPHRDQAPWGPQSDWELWLLNDLYMHKLPAFNPQRVRWFVLHPWDQTGPDGKPAMYSVDRAHTQALGALLDQGGRVYLKEARPELPKAEAYPYQEVYDFFRDRLGGKLKYFTNTISFELALAIMEGATEIGLYGVDMMTGGRGGINNEYGYQRPSCEYWLGIAEAMGITVHLPDQSDLMKSAFVYGDYDGNLFRNKMEQRMVELKTRIEQCKAQHNAIQTEMQQHVGALGQLEAIYHTWLPGDDGSPQAPIPIPHGKSARTGQPIMLQAEDGTLLRPVASDGPNRVVELVQEG